MDFDFSKYRIHIPKEKTAASLLEPNESTFPLNEKEIYSYNEGIKIILKENRGLWLSRDVEYNNEVWEYFKELGVNGF